MMKITGLFHLFKWENLHNWWLTKYFFAPLYVLIIVITIIGEQLCTNTEPTAKRNPNPCS